MNKRKLERELKKDFEEVLRENDSQNKTRAADVIFSEIDNGLGKLYILIEKYNNSFEDSEIKGRIKIKESTEGDLLKKQIKLWTDYVKDRINELKNRIRTEFDLAVSARKTNNINRYSHNINSIKMDILSKDKIEANSIIRSPESNEIYLKCLSYINLIKDLNEIINKHNRYFSKINRQDQVIDTVWDEFN